MQIQQKNLLKVQKDFVHGMTHEFNTPLSNIKLVAQNLKKSSDPKVLKSASILEEEAGKLQVGTNLILTTALIEKNELLLQKENFDVKEILRKTVDRNKDVLYDSGIKLILETNGEDLNAQCDAFHLENVFQNMINNVRKHSEADVLKVATERNNGHLIIRFSDNGKGILEEDRSRIFEKFQSKHNNGAKNGYGLGLYYSRMILEMHGGKISLLDDIKKGSTFSIQIPA
jgi:two-component system phosphate regulon sensor histidine kinase PhoR